MNLVLLGDSIFDNGAYTNGGPAVIDQVRERLPDGWQASLSAFDGASAGDVPGQLAELPSGATHLVLSAGGNDALRRLEILGMPAESSAATLLLLHDIAREFEAVYRRAIDSCLERALPLVVCTIYNGNFPEQGYQQCATTALTAFNDVIIRVAIEKRLRVIDLRLICSSPADYANPIEPSSIGGARIAAAIMRAVTEPAHTGRGAQVVAA